MPRRKAEVSSDEEYVEDSSSSSNNDSPEEYDDDDDDDYSPDAEQQQTSTPTKRAGRTGKTSSGNNIKKEEPEQKPEDGDSNNPLKRKRKSRINYKDPMIDDLTSTQRKTKAGGYAHTNKSKERISRANTGNTPWNKGKQRSSADKAKIKAGVQARNRAIKLEKLKRLGMTEEEYDQKKKEIKYLRERVRRTKLANDKHNAAKAQKKLQEALDATNDKAPKTVKLKKAPKAKAGKPKPTVAAPPVIVPRNQVNEAVFKSDFSWAPISVWKEGESYDNACPNGGPGGLVCCRACAKQYSSYLNTTLKEMEVQRTDKVGGELKEILEFLDKEKSVLDRATNFAKKKAPPVPRISNQAEPPSRQQGVRRTAVSSRQGQESANFHEWNITSTIDIVAPSQTAIV